MGVEEASELMMLMLLLLIVIGLLTTFGLMFGISAIVAAIAAGFSGRAYLRRRST